MFIIEINIKKCLYSCRLLETDVDDLALIFYLMYDFLLFFSFYS